jgi:hypothetical protein
MFKLSTHSLQTKHVTGLLLWNPAHQQCDKEAAGLLKLWFEKMEIFLQFCKDTNSREATGLVGRACALGLSLYAFSMLSFGANQLKSCSLISKIGIKIPTLE